MKKPGYVYWLLDRPTLFAFSSWFKQTFYLFVNTPNVCLLLRGIIKHPSPLHWEELIRKGDSSFLAISRTSKIRSSDKCLFSISIIPFEWSSIFTCQFLQIKSSVKHMSCLVTSFDRLSNQKLILNWKKCRTNIWWKFAFHMFVYKGLQVEIEKNVSHVLFEKTMKITNVKYLKCID